MPTYEYECLDKGHRFEEFQSMTDEPIQTCPVCGGPTRRLISGGAGIIFKGSGFYQTDYRSDSYKKEAKAEASGGSESSDSSAKRDSGKKSGDAASKKSGDGEA